MNDLERLDLPSASKFEIPVNCPGQPNLYRQIRDRLKEEEPDEDAESGTRIHTARETENTTELGEEEMEKYLAGRRYEESIVENWKLAFDIAECFEGPRELRLWLNDPVTLDPMASGQLDVHYISHCRRFLLIVDWKTGWSWNLTPSNRNWQLRLQAVLALLEYPEVEKVWVSFVKPIAKSDRIDITAYDRTQLEIAQKDVFYHLWRASQPDAQRTPGSHCRYCPCKPFCPEGGAYSMLPSVMANEISPADMVSAVELMDPADLALLHSRAGVIIKILEAAKKRLKAMPAEELAKYGLKVGEGRKLDPIKDVRSAFDALKTFGIKEEELWTAMRISKEELVKAVRRSEGWAAAQTESWLWNQILKPFIEPKKSDGSLEKL